MSVTDSKDESALENLVIKDDKEVRTIIFTLDFNWKNIILYFQFKNRAFQPSWTSFFQAHAKFFSENSQRSQPGFPGARKLTSVSFAAEWL